MKIKTIIFSVLFLSVSSAFGQQKLEGRFINEDLEPVPAVTIYSKDTTKLGISDLQGNFKIDFVKKIDTLIFASIGSEWTKIKLLDNCKNIEVILLYDALYHYKSHKKIDRLRKRRFDKIAELHSEAYIKKLFKTMNPCFEQKYSPIKPELDEVALNLKKTAIRNKNDFKNLKIGDTIKIPFGIDDSKKIVRTVYSLCKNCTDKDYDYLIKGIIVNKQRRKLTLEIKVIEIPIYDSLEFNGEKLSVNNTFKYKMKYFKVITQ